MLPQTLTLRAAFASSTYLLPQIPGPGRSSDDDLLNSRIIQTYFFRGHPLSKGVIGACGLSIAACPSLPAISGPSSEDALVTLGRISLLCRAAALNPDDARGLFVLYVFAAVTGWAKSTLLPTSFDSRVQIRHFCTRHAIFERSRGQIVGFCPRGCKLILRSLLFRYIVTLLSQTLTLCVAFSSSMYLLP